jgi:dolichyl-phosphate-mannose--protein O-mannosyl transferase
MFLILPAIHYSFPDCFFFSVSCLLIYLVFLYNPFLILPLYVLEEMVFLHYKTSRGQGFYFLTHSIITHIWGVQYCAKNSLRDVGVWDTCFFFHVMFLCFFAFCRTLLGGKRVRSSENRASEWEKGVGGENEEDTGGS